MIDDPAHREPLPELGKQTASSELLRRYVEEGSEAAFAEFVRQTIGFIYSAALRRSGDPHHAADITQKVFISAAHHARALMRHPQLTGWLYTATRNAALNVMREEQRRRRREHAAHALHANENRTAPIDWEQLHPVLDDAMDELKDRDREAVLLRFFENRPLVEIGAYFRVTENAARMRVDRALDKLRTILVQRGVTSTSAALAAALSAQTISAAPVGLAGTVSGIAVASGVASAAAPVLLGFMSVTKVQMAIGVAAMLTVGVAVYEIHRARAIRAALAFNQRELYALEARVAGLARERATLAAAAPAQVPAPTSVVKATAGSDETTPADAELERLRELVRQRHALDRAQPEYQQLQREQRKRALSREYGRLYLQLGLNLTEIERFEAAIAEHDSLADDIDSAARAQGIHVSDSAIVRMKGEVKDRLDAALKELLGPADYERFLKFNDTVSLRCEITDRVAAILHASEFPLDAAQSDRLTEMLSRHANRRERDHRFDPLDVNWPAALADTHDVLAPAQRTALEAIAADQRWRTTFYAAIGRLNPTPAAASAPETSVKPAR